MRTDRQHLPGKTEAGQQAHGIGAELDAGTDLPEGRGLFEQHEGQPGAAQAERGGDAADTAAGDDDRCGTHRTQIRRFWAFQ